MEMTWIAIAASLLMGSGALLIFIWALKNHQFHSFEEVKYQVFWSDLDFVEETDASHACSEEPKNGSSRVEDK